MSFTVVPIEWIQIEQGNPNLDKGAWRISGRR